MPGQRSGQQDHERDHQGKAVTRPSVALVFLVISLVIVLVGAGIAAIFHP